jgi:hypothetical protein
MNFLEEFDDNINNLIDEGFYEEMESLDDLKDQDEDNEHDHFSWNVYKEYARFDDPDELAN